MKKTVIVGCGDIGRRVGQSLLAAGQNVIVTARTEQRAAQLRAMGFNPLIGDFDYRESVPDITLHDCLVYYFLPPQGGGRTDARMLNFCRQLSSENCPAKLVYLSTSGVYGDCGGELVTEETPVNPQTSRAQRRISAENQLREQAQRLGFELVILRVTGIYGPGRLPLARITQGHPVIQPGEAPLTNRIHSQDLVRICIAAMEKGEDGDIFNVCDGQASSMSEYFLAVADACRLPRPRQISMQEAEREMNPLMLSYQRESRRMSNRKMLEKLGIELLYPNLQAGLEACLEDQ